MRIKFRQIVEFLGLKKNELRQEIFEELGFK